MRVGIYGSCISRDIFNLERPGLEMSGYFARSSWISATNPSVARPNVQSRLTSPFQQRMVERDFLSSSITGLLALDSDLILLDLIDERAGVVRAESGGYLTYLSEMKGSGWLDHVRHSSLIRFGTPMHLNLFKDAAAKVLESLNGCRVVVLASKFASNTEDGKAVPPASGRSAEEWNDLYAEYFGVLEQIGFDVLRMPDELCIADSKHRWGVAPYHYIEDFYSEAARLLAETGTHL